MSAAGKEGAVKAPLPFGYQFIAGAVAGVSELLVMYPLDVVKTRMQLQSSVRGGAGGGEVYSGLVDCLSKIIKREGARTLYRGISSPILMEAPKRATKFAFNEKFQKLYANVVGLAPGKTNQAISILAGASAGITEAFVIVPFELVKVRCQDAAAKVNGPMEVLKAIVKKDGVLGLYNGLEATVWRHALWNSGYFGIIFQVRKLLPAAKSKSEKVRNDLLAGTVGGTMGCIFNTPFDVVKSRIQSSGNSVVDPADATKTIKKYNWSVPAVKTIYKEEGFSALYKGFVPKIARLGPGGGILLIVFGTVTEFFEKMRE
ncbi:mitochondrial 2-oxodicarboxylate carrier KNAG_0J01540 [Huiozyma naganishii CBS 8797]|uniref:Mitochondrial 2-oxodicarboxylate carrier 1 n=1 Tax=Huiozyma naganishii (strain ATCC MYA-139 / BCRC 22969 / CBS 8797 / KCTC 17520 / NBRC 10181 / NCYC 3082 / Yp74L-3) TaxID=1071383 RepID=J7RBI0_HUIN7|nr:hypothetical protein KNAG_0J01540 [Kazachstania naganishii CBS 8797]CCK72235.1 hypothetical protein KNAG_0J01540 [Kazachstania naganishii CBS 8797]